MSTLEAAMVVRCLQVEREEVRIQRRGNWIQWSDEEMCKWSDEEMCKSEAAEQRLTARIDDLVERFLIR